MDEQEVRDRLATQRDEAVADALELNLAYTRLQSMVEKILPAIEQYDEALWRENEYVDLTEEVFVHHLFKLREVIDLNEKLLTQRKLTV